MSTNSNMKDLSAPSSSYHLSQRQGAHHGKNQIYKGVAHECEEGKGASHDKRAQQQQQQAETQQAEAQQREFNLRTLSMLWEKPSYRAPSPPTLDFDGPRKDSTKQEPRRKKLQPGTERLAGNGKVVSQQSQEEDWVDPEAFNGSTSLENWVTREHRHEKFWERDTE